MPPDDADVAEKSENEAEDDAKKFQFSLTARVRK